MWTVDVLVCDAWQPIRPTGGKPYTFETADEATSARRLMHPEDVRRERLGDEPKTRITPHMLSCSLHCGGVCNCHEGETR